MKTKKFFGVVLSYTDIVKILACLVGVIDGFIWLVWLFCFAMYSGLILISKKDEPSGDLLPNWAHANLSHPLLMIIGIACAIYAIYVFMKMENKEKKDYIYHPLTK